MAVYCLSERLGALSWWGMLEDYIVYYAWTAGESVTRDPEADGVELFFLELSPALWTVPAD